ncbi:UDP-N-acetylmuramate dehydrogenase [Thioalkalivibrio sp. ALJ24]|uniref:UDP-N-acetylmuramate dehydrogenase n=1 Tax=Thioalkalivibrio sp. ALJ24 TaxID=545276 RepID=UPI0003753ED2|nr:UDP-N-acetylmuramate dehydrogenase [Thioalkalivibrio sp. ALJ24]
MIPLDPALAGIHDLRDLAPRGELRARAPLAPLTSWRAGGVADWLFRPADRDDLAHLLAALAQRAPDLPITFLGLGSNVLIRDGGIAGLVVHLQGVLAERERLEGDRVFLGGGLACAQAARFCAREGLVGAEFLAGIPGTVGGALQMNAGAWGGETWPLVESVEVIDRAGRRSTRAPDAFRVGYRRVQGGDPGERLWFTGATLRLSPGDPEAGTRRIRELLRERSAKQPLGQPSCGSVFRNPKGDHAARLIEAAGLKGLRSGKAEVSAVHANFITHDGTARAADIERLIDTVRNTVEQRFGVRLEPEVRILGRFTDPGEDGEGEA